MIRGSVRRITNQLANSNKTSVRAYSSKKVDVKYSQLFINNEFVNALSGKTFQTVNPATEEVITNVQEAQKEDVDVAVRAARNAFEPWRNTSPAVRSELLWKWAEAIEANKEYIADLECLDNGKPRQMVLDADIFLTVECLKYSAGWCDKEWIY